MASSGDSAAAVQYGVPIRDLAAIRVQLDGEENPHTIQAYVDQHNRLVATRNESIRTKNRDCNYTVVLVVALAVIAAVGAASLIATSGGPTNMLTFYGGVACGTLSIGLVVFSVAFVIHTAVKKRRLDRDYQTESRVQIQHTDIIEVMRQQGLRREVVQEVLRHMRGESFAQFVTIALQGDQANNQPILEAIAQHEDFQTLTDVDQQLATLMNVADSIVADAVRAFSDDTFAALVQKVVDDENASSLLPALGQDSRIAGCSPTYQLVVLSGLDEAGRRALLGHLNDGQYTALVAEAVSQIDDYAFAVAPLTDDLRIAGCTPEQQIALAKKLDANQRVALVAKLNQEEYQAFVLKAVENQVVTDFVLALKTQPAQVAALSGEESVTARMLVSCYVAMSMPERAAFLEALPAVSAKKSANPKNFDLIMGCFKQTFGQLTSPYPDALIIQYARYPEFFGYAVVHADVEKRVPLLKTFNTHADDTARQTARKQMTVEYNSYPAKAKATLTELAALTDSAEISSAVAQSGLVERYKDHPQAFKKAVTEDENYPLIVAFLDQFGPQAVHHLAVLDSSVKPGKPRLVALLKLLLQETAKDELKQQAVAAWDAWKPPLGLTKPNLDLSAMRTS
ncbi:MAG: hypothetical protein S4CHLAM2_02960 [Chlamydiales bacterium]|nr:hypothetical protein [Chlamydiales bacterium]